MMQHFQTTCDSKCLHKSKRPILFKIRFNVGEFTTAWQKLEQVIVTGCTISAIFLVMGMSLMTTAAERGKKKTKDGVLNTPTTDNTCTLPGRTYITLAS